MSKRAAAVLDTPEPGYAPESKYPRRKPPANEPWLRRDPVEDFAESSVHDEPRRPRQAVRPSLKLKISSRIPKTLFGRIVTGVALLAIVGSVVALMMVARTFLLHDPRFRIQSPASIEIQGNEHLTRSQLLNIFGDDVDRNIFRISLDDRQAELEALPWVQHATIMRLLPGRIRIAIVERKPVAFIRQGGHIGLVDAEGVLLDMTSGAPAGAQPEPHYSFPVVTGIAAADPASTRAARMRIFERFTADLDGAGQKISENLSEVDLSNPEDVKALIPDHANEVLVHFGDDHFLDRYRRFQELLPQWRSQFPNLASVDMRYEREVVLDMAKPATAKAEAARPLVDKAAAVKAPDTEHAKALVPSAPRAKTPAKASAKPGHTPVKPLMEAHTVVHPAVSPAAHSGPHPAAVASKPGPAQVTAATKQPPHPAAAVQAPGSATPSASAAARSSYPAAHVLKTPPSSVSPKAASQPAKGSQAPGHSASVTAKPSTAKPPAPRTSAAEPHAAKPPAGKPSAAKPLSAADHYHPPQVAIP